MNCQNCGAPMVFDPERIIFSCAYCSSVYYPDESRDGIRLSDVQQDVSCPVCKVPLVLGFVGSIRVTCCPKCRGSLIDQSSFLTVIQYIRIHSRGIEEPPPPVKMEELKRQIACPKCGQTMDTHPYGGPGNIIIDNCPACQINWLDYMELYRVTHSPDGKVNDRDDRFDDRNLLEYQKKYFRMK